MLSESRLNKGAEILDKSSAQRLIINNPDFDRYMIQRDSSDHANVKQASEFKTGLLEFFSGDLSLVGDKLPWVKTHDLIRLRPSEVTLWAGYNGHGKSLLLGQTMTHLLKAQKVCIASFEMRPVTTLARMCRQTLGSDRPTEDYLNRFCERLIDKLWIYDQHGTVSQERVISVVYYAAEKLGVKHFVIDSLMKCGISEDDYNGQKRFVDRLCAAAKDTGCHIHLVAHSRKGQDEFNPPSKMDVKGSGTITDQVDNVMTVWRNKRKELLLAAGKGDDKLNAEADAFIICDKQRNGEWEGKIGLWYDKQGTRFSESRHAQMNFANSLD